MSLSNIQALIQDDIMVVDDLIRQRLYSRVELVSQIGEHIVHSGGKRARPMLLLLVANALAYDGGQHHELAAIIEFIHTATLLHDDVVDGSLLRRGLDTANAVWGPQASVLVGDFLYSRAFQMMVSLQQLPVMDILANTTNVIAEGEVLQLLNARDADTSQSRYFDVIRCKTAELFCAAGKLGGLVSGADQTIIDAMGCYGMQFGMAYQIIDDLLDYQAEANTLGKNIGDDLAEGKPTLPLIYIMQNGSEAQKNLVRDAIENANVDKLAEIQQAIHDTKALDYVRSIAESEKQGAIEALQILPASAYKQGLVEMVEFAVNRGY